VPKFTIGSEHECRIIGYSAMERQLMVSTKPVHLAKNVVALEEATPGTKLKGTIRGISQRGIMVEFGDGLMGFVAAIHALDMPVKNWQNRFQKGSKK
jgi:rRNA biogenesis protein RRP5